MNGPWTEEGRNILKHLVSGAWTEDFLNARALWDFSDLKKSPSQGLDFLSNNFLIIVWGVQEPRQMLMFLANISV